MNLVNCVSPSSSYVMSNEEKSIKILVCDKRVPVYLSLASGVLGAALPSWCVCLYGSPQFLTVTKMCVWCDRFVEFLIPNN